MALAAPQMHHRTPEARAIVKRTRELLRRAYCLPEEGWEVLIVTASGTGAMEAAISSLVPQGATVATLSAGKFGERWTGMSRALGLEVIARSFPWGSAIPASAAGEVLREHPATSALILTHSETSTGTLHDLREIAAAARAANPDVLLIVDAVTSLAVSELRPAEWGLDAVVSGSQKGVGGPPGLGFVALSPRAVEVVRERAGHLGPYYFGLARELKAQAEGETAFTPAINVVAALAAGLEPIVEGGVEERWRELRSISEAVTSAGLALGCRAYAERPSPACSTLVPPDPVTGRDLVKALLKRGARAQGGQDAIKDTVTRISLMGHFDRYDALAVAGLLEDALADCGASFKRGTGVTAAWRVLSKAGS
jgi:aspartate aminotransferase-like enzyme